MKRLLAIVLSLMCLSTVVAAQQIQPKQIGSGTAWNSPISFGSPTPSVPGGSGELIQLYGTPSVKASTDYAIGVNTGYLWLGGSTGGIQLYGGTGGAQLLAQFDADKSLYVLPAIYITSSPVINSTYNGSTTALTNGNLIASGGSYISFCPVASCLTTPTLDHQRASALFWNTTKFDNFAEENNVVIETVINSGAMKTWYATTSYNLNDNINFGPQNTTYRQTSSTNPCTTGSSEPAFTSTTVPYSDGTCTWTWINASAISGKVGLYSEEVVQGPGANRAATWNAAFNTWLQPGLTPNFNIGIELDFGNAAANCPYGINCIGMLISMGGSYTSSAGLVITGNSTTPYAAIWGIRLASTYLASQAAIEDDTGGPVGLGFNVSTLGVGHSTADIQSLSTSTQFILDQGTHSSAGIAESSTSPAGIVIGGTHSTGVQSAIYDASTSGNGIWLNGTYSSTQISGTGWSVSPAGKITTTGVAFPSASTLTSGSGAPSGTQPNGSIYMRVDGTTSNRIYISNGSSWTAMSGI